jgi:hypothetical protein
MTPDQKIQKAEERTDKAIARASQFEKLLKPMELDLKTIDHLIQHIAVDLATATPAAIRAVLLIVEDIASITRCYR